MAPSIDQEDPNVAAELDRIMSTHGVARARTRTVYYATNRELINPNANGVDRFGSSVGQTMHYGSASVRIPPTHEYGGKIEAPYWTWFDNPNKHFRVVSLNRLRQNDFFDVMHRFLESGQAPDARTKNDVILYVHGFNTSMKFSLLRLAQVAYDIGFEGSACAFVWPSDSRFYRYGDDLSDATKSIPALTDLLDRLCRAGDEGRVHVIAHSMGNYLTLQAIEALANKWQGYDTSERPSLGHVILAAPDVWTEEFVRWTPRAIGVAQTVTLYHCKDDKPLKLSIAKNEGKPRAGLASVTLLGLDNVNCDEANTTFLGHGAYADESPLLFDTQMLLQRDSLPEDRPLLRLHQPMPNYWLWKARADLAPVITSGGSP